MYNIHIQSLIHPGIQPAKQITQGFVKLKIRENRHALIYIYIANSHTKKNIKIQFQL